MYSTVLHAASLTLPVLGHPRSQSHGRTVRRPGVVGIKEEGVRRETTHELPAMESELLATMSSTDSTLTSPT